MKIRFDPALPITERHDEIAAAIRDHQVVVVAGETGSGKTTQLPKIAYELGLRSVAHTQPRRIAARSVAKRIAQECEVELGAEVGYAVRFDDQTSDATVLRLVTDGLLLAELQRDRRLSRYDMIIIDEAHERSLSIDFLLGYLKQLLPRRPELKVVITSATIDVERFAEMFSTDQGPAPIIEVSGRTFPVEVRYRPRLETGADDDLEAIAQAVAELPSEGDVLVFLSGEREIRDAADHLAGKKLPRTEILPLYGRLAAADQQKIFSDHPGRRIVLSTNVAETSLTVPGIRFVVDTGLARISRFSQRLKVQRLPIEPISQASAAQRAGRCGRVADGICIRLYSEEDFDGRPEFTDPEIQRTNLASVLLQMASLDLGSIADFPFLDPPDSRAVTDGLNLLYELGAMDGKRLTKIGRRMSTLPTDPRLARMILAADKLGVLADVLVIVAAMSIQDPRERPLEHQQAADQKHARFREPDSDFLSYLTLWRYIREQRNELSGSAFRRLCRDEFLHWLRIREWQDVHSQLRRTVREMGFEVGQPGNDPDRVHQALLSGLLSHVGLRDVDGRDYLGARQARFMIFPGSGLAKKPPRMAMVGELVETSRLWGRTAAKIEPEWVEQVGEHLVNRSYSQPHWSTRRGAAMAREKVLLFGVPIVADRLVQLGRIDPVVARDLFIRHALVQGEWRTNHRFWAENQRMLADVEALEDRLRRRDLKVDDDTLYAFYDERVPDHVVSTRHFDSWWKVTRRDQPDLLTFDPALLSRDTADVDEEFPREWHADGGESFPLSYAFEPGLLDDGVTVDLPLTQLLTVDPRRFVWHVPGHRVELVTELIRSLPKVLRRELVPAGQHAPALVEAVDPAADDVLDELARQIRLLTGTVVSADDFDVDALPSHLRVTFRVTDDGTEVGRGKDLEALRRELADHLRADLTEVAKQEERSGLRTWDVGTIDASITAGQVTGYPALVDEGTSVALRIVESPEEQSVAMVRGQARLLALALPTPVPQLGRSLDLHAKLLLSTGPHRDAAEVIEESWLTALQALLVRHSGPAWDAGSFALLQDLVRADAYAETEQVVRVAQAVLRALGEVSDLPSTAVGEDVRVQLSWMIYPGFIRDTGVDRLRRLPVYLQAAGRLLSAGGHPDLAEVQDLEAELHRRTADLSPTRRLAPDVADVRWALEELRVSLFAQHLRADRPISLKRARALVEQL